MKLSEFRFDLPKRLVAQHPPEERDGARMMVINRETGDIEHKQFKDFPEYFKDGDVQIVNDTQVFPARLYGNKEKTGARIEVFLLRELNQDARLWDVLVDPARKIRVGNKLYFGEGELVAEVIDNTTSRGRTIRFLFDGGPEDFYVLIDKLGQTPLPKYITREAEPEDRERFQTIFAKETGAVAAPSAGLHFTPQMVKRLELQGVQMVPITMHVGLGSFREVDVEDLTKHKMDSENFNVPAHTCQVVNKAMEERRRICAIGTTTMRAIESAVSANNKLKENKGWTDKFIFPPYDFKIANSLLCNFHGEGSTLYMLACAFGGYELITKAYKVAIKEKYRFLTYGDCMLII